MACSSTTIQDQACESGIGKQRDRIKLLQWAVQLTCEVGQTSASSEWSYTRVEAPGLNYIFLATTNTTLELECIIDTHSGGPAILRIQKEHDGGAPVVQDVAMDDGGALELKTVVTVFLRENDLLTVSNASGGGGFVILNSVNIYQQQ